MARQLKRFTTRTVATLAKVGRHADGGNLYLTISRTAAGGLSKWTFMFTFAEAGFGSVSTVTLAEAREQATECRSKLAKGIDPLNAKKAALAAEAARRIRPVRRRAHQIEAVRMAEPEARLPMEQNNYRILRANAG